MEWIKINIFTTKEGIEPVCGTLLNCGINGMQIEDKKELVKFLEESSPYWDYVDEELLNNFEEETKVIAYLSDNIYGQEILLNLKNSIENLKNIEPSLGFSLGSLNIETTANLDENVWLNKWKEFYKPLPIGNKILVKPEWEKVESKEGRIIFNINPGHVFGTGLHQTTQLCVEQLEKYVTNKTKILDLGCGSGILSIISLLLGGEEAFALDIDKNAVKTAYENAKLNNIDKAKYYVTYGNIIDDENLQNEIENNKYEIIVANIVADVICSICKLVSLKIAKNGIFIASGIIKDRVEDVYNSLTQSGFEVLNTIFKDEWVCIVSKLK